MNIVSNLDRSISQEKPLLELQRLLLVAATSPNMQSPQASGAGECRIFQLDACFKAGGTWAGVDNLIEIGYLDLLQAHKRTVLEQYQLELYSVLLKYRDQIKPCYLSLTDTAGADERTRFYAPDRAYRLVHGLIGLVLNWKRTLHNRARWVVIVRNFDDAQHLATRFFSELARRATPADGIDVIVETRAGLPSVALRMPDMDSVPAASWITTLRRDTVARRDMTDSEASTLDLQIADGVDLALEPKYLELLNFYRSRNDGPAAARMALKMLIIYKGYGYYHECRTFVDAILPHLGKLVGDDEFKRISHVAKMHICLVMTDEPITALSVVKEHGAPFVSMPHLLAEINYILGMHYLRFAETKDIALAERHIVSAVENVRLAVHTPPPFQYPFVKVFVDNGLAFLRVRQGRHQEALDLCQSGFEFITRELGEHRHVLHRSILLYNIAQVYVMMGDLENGLEYYLKTISMDPNYSEYHNEVGNILQEQGRYREAVDYYVSAVRCSAPYPEVYFNKGVCHARLEEFEDALGCFDFSLELNPDQSECHALKADVLRELGHPDEALAGYDIAVAQGYDPPAVLVNRAVLHYNKGSFELALSDMNRVIAQDAADSAHYENRAAIYQALDQQDLYLRDLWLAKRHREAA